MSPDSGPTGRWLQRWRMTPREQSCVEPRDHRDEGGRHQGRLPGGGAVRVFKPEWEGVHLGGLCGEGHLSQREQNTQTDLCDSP